MNPLLDKRRRALNLRGVLYLAVLLSCLALIALDFRPTVRINTWSLSYVTLAMNGRQGLNVLPAPPEGHRRGLIWLAAEAIEVGEPERALAMLSDNLARKDPDALRIQGKAFAEAGKYDEAVASWVWAGDYPSLAQGANKAESENRVDFAELAYRGAWQVDPLLGSIPLANFLWHVRGDPGAAEQILRQGLAVGGSTHINRLRTLGLVLQAQSKWDQAIAVFDQALEEKPDDQYTMQLIGYAYADGRQDYARAQGVFERMIELAPDEGQGYLAMGQLFERQGRYDEADQWLVQALMKAPDDPWYWVARANVLRKAQKILPSLEIYRQAVARFPEFAPAYFEMAWACRLANQPEEAIRSIRDALERQERPDPWYLVRAGEIYEWAGDIDSARAAYRQSLKIIPANPAATGVALDALDRLDVNGE